METINDYVNVDDEKEEVKTKKEKKKTKKECDIDDDETFKKRVTLISKKEDMNFSSSEIKCFNKNRINILYELYEEKLNDSFLDNFLEPFVEMFIKLLSQFLIFDDEHELKKDLMENQQFRKIINRSTSGITSRFGEKNNFI